MWEIKSCVSIRRGRQHLAIADKAVLLPLFNSLIVYTAGQLRHPWHGFYCPGIGWKFLRPIWKTLAVSGFVWSPSCEFCFGGKLVGCNRRRKKRATTTTTETTGLRSFAELLLGEQKIIFVSRSVRLCHGCRAESQPAGVFFFFFSCLCNLI